MPQESLGYVKLEWTCPKCRSRNPGPEKTCLSCGAPQPADVQFEQPERQELITDPRALEEAKQGPDIHCAFCGTRNPANAQTCSQCGADLKDGLRRQAGQVVGAFASGPAVEIKCPNCGSANPESALKCAHCGAPLQLQVRPTAAAPPAGRKLSLWAIIALALVGIACLIGAVSLISRATRMEEMVGVVEGVKWTTMVYVEALRPVRYQGWRQEIPPEAEIGSCSLRVHHVQDQPAENANKICGTPYNVDKGSGYAEVVQDCQYEVLMDYCDYQVIQWQRVDTLTLSGNDLQPRFAEPALSSDSRLGGQEAIFEVVFRTPAGQISYTTDDQALFAQLLPGSRWQLTINGFGAIVAIAPAP